MQEKFNFYIGYLYKDEVIGAFTNLTQISYGTQESADKALAMAIREEPTTNWKIVKLSIEDLK